MKNSRGFTLIEILMVVVLLGVVAIVAFPQFVDFGTNAKTAVTNEKLITIKQAIIGDPRVIAGGQVVSTGFINQVGSVPTTLNDLIAQGGYTTYNPFTKVGWRGPYVNSTDPSWNVDAWGTALVYSQAGRYIRSCGPDKTCGNADDITVNF